MSDQQLQKLRMERDALSQELKVMKSAMPADKASGKLVESMTNKTDPFNDPNNEWVNEGPNKNTCCSIQ